MRVESNQDKNATLRWKYSVRCGTMNIWFNNQTSPHPLTWTRANVGFGCWGNGVIFQNKPKGCVMIDVHKRCLQTWGDNNYQTLKRKMHIFNYGRKVIMNCKNAWLKEVWAPLDLKNILLQNGSIENMKPRTQIWSHQNPTPYKNRWGTNLHI